MLKIEIKLYFYENVTILLFVLHSRRLRKASININTFRKSHNYNYHINNL